MSKPVVNQDLCIGCGNCQNLCPEVFKVTDGKSQVIADSCESCNCDEVIAACPVSAISMSEE